MPPKTSAAAVGLCTSTSSLSHVASWPYSVVAHSRLAARNGSPTIMPRCPHEHRARCYAAHSSKPTEPSDATPPWPRAAHPTPYEILGMQRGAPYTKRRFYQLVKLYHPDTHDQSAAGLPAGQQHLSKATRLERYRLVVAANDVLSDPHKRSLYDHHGIGWTDDRRSHDLGEADRAWRRQPGNASRNATWEDWERWRDERSGKPSEPMYMSNGMFAALVVCMCMIGALAQMSRAEAAGEQYVDFVQQKDWAIGQKMRQSTMAATGRSKDERVDCFLRERENLAFDFEPHKLDRPPPSPPPGRSE
ncbi:hypothetical protein E4U42_002460 [Claviceps africana]|uniref:J domain-containing protein n=1 Tax=Claviceps africana TaxID=83212 RepID=A0A8K0NJK5_9HYPO|nr:hypothetical protein E4U42_002460 [Claviceps africana]